jgi:hypothetical protein
MSKARRKPPVSAEEALLWPSVGRFGMHLRQIGSSSYQAGSMPLKAIM